MADAGPEVLVEEWRDPEGNVISRKDLSQTPDLQSLRVGPPQLAAHAAHEAALKAGKGKKEAFEAARAAFEEEKEYQAKRKRAPEASPEDSMAARYLLAWARTQGVRITDDMTVGDVMDALAFCPPPPIDMGQWAANVRGMTSAG